MIFFYKVLCILSGLQLCSLLILCNASDAQTIGQRVYLRDLPQAVMELYVNIALFEVLTKSQLEILNWVKNEDLVQYERELNDSADLYENVMKDYKKFDQSFANIKYFSDFQLNRYDITLYDTRKMLPKILKQKEEVANNICSTLNLNIEEKSARAQLHNFLVLYTKNVLRITCEPLQLNSLKGDLTGKLDVSMGKYIKLYELFAPGEDFVRLHTYLEDFSNIPFMRKQNFYITLYFRYLSVAYNMKQTDMVLREFIWARKDLHKKFPELIYLGKIFFFNQLSKFSE